MIIPICCFGCGKIIAHQWNKYNNLIQEEYLKNINESNININNLDGYEFNISPEFKAKILDDMGFTRYCCRGMILTHIDICDKI
jgi:DNA-directed RNA polymerase I, II, and III subunit RPABC5